MKEVKLKCDSKHETFESLIDSLSRSKSSFTYQNFIDKDVTIFLEPKFASIVRNYGGPAVNFVIGKINKESLNTLNPVVIIQKSILFIWINRLILMLIGVFLIISLLPESKPLIWLYILLFTPFPIGILHLMYKFGEGIFENMFIAELQKTKE